MFTDSILQTKSLLVDNSTKIIVFLAISLFAFLVYYITMRSLRNLKTEILSTYPFDLFIPKNSTWSVGYFMIMILFLGLLIVFFVKGNFVTSPL